MRGGRRLVVIGLAAVLVIVVAAGAYLLLRPDPKSAVSPLPPEQARPSAERACALMREFEAQVVANEQADIALETLEQAAEASNRASRGDVVWVPLESGIRAVRAGFEKNDGPATQIGIRVVRNACVEFAPPVPSP